MSGALRAVALLAGRHPDIRLTLLGPGDRGDAFKLQAAALGIVSLVDMPRDDATAETDRATVAAAELGWVLSLADDAMFAMLDCFAAGVPVLAERNPLTGRLVRDGESGVLIPALDAPDTAAEIAALLADGARRGRLAGGARAAAASWPPAAMAGGFERATAAARDRTRWRA